MNKKQVIRFNENQLRKIVTESVNKIVEMLRESENVDLEKNIRKIWIVFDRLKNEINSDDGNYSIHAVNLRKAMNGDEKAKNNLFFWIKSATGFEEYMLDTVFDAWCEKNGVLREGADVNFDDFDSVEATRIGKHKKRRGVKTKGSTENRDFLRQQTAKGNPIIKYKRNPKEWFDNFMNQSDNENQLSETKLNRIVKESVKRVLKEGLWQAIESDGYQVYDSFVNFIKDYYAPNDNELAYKIEDEIHAWMVKMMADLDSKYKLNYIPDGTMNA